MGQNLYLFYAFTLQLYLSPIAPEKLRALLGAVVEYGHYVVLVALLAQTALFSLDRMGSRPEPAAES